ncbi:hypothetical protein B597_006450 [Stutzerimonas stutzeri KOS6]|uniref:Lipopolysaccharide core biosynthesis protein n=1 Tax=Stutzerimonas stutzeri KOS6 TaxID=1218352 RepID=A0A061JV80_STUST|nr:hypothetical protein B597_006450 [Stutzerimonas stutzeri KOS6]
MKEIHAYDDAVLEGKQIYLLERANRQFGHRVKSDRLFAWSVRKDEEICLKFSLLRQKTNRIGFSRNLSRGYFVARTIPYAGAQLAFHLGFRLVFIVGMDLNPSVGRFYESDEAKVLPTSLDRHYEDYIVPSFKLMSRKVCREGGFQVFNLSKDSRLPASVLPKIALSELDEYISANLGVSV